MTAFSHIFEWFCYFAAAATLVLAIICFTSPAYPLGFVDLILVASNSYFGWHQRGWRRENADALGRTRSALKGKEQKVSK